jgi:hypothetical protein
MECATLIAARNATFTTVKSKNFQRRLTMPPMWNVLAKHSPECSFRASPLGVTILRKKPDFLTVAAISAAGIVLTVSPCYGQLGTATPPDQSPSPQADLIKSEDNTATPQATAGPLQEKRQALLAKIYQAKSQGIGIAAYKSAFDFIEELAKSGGDQANLEKRIGSLDTSLEDQFKRSALLKVQKLSPNNSSTGNNLPIPGADGMMGPGPMAGNSDPASLIQKLQNKFGGQIPADLQAKYGNKIPASLKNKLGDLNNLGSDPNQLLQNDKVKELLKNLKK